jgi:hypothetical protein
MLAPNNIAIIKSARKMKKRTFAIEAAPSAIPPNPKMAAMMAITKKITDQRNIVLLFMWHMPENHSFSTTAEQHGCSCSFIKNLHTQTFNHKNDQ